MIDIYKSIPNELKLSALWCCWKYINNKNGDNIKMPFNPLTGYAAKSNDKSTFVSYPTLMHYANSYIAFEGKKQIGGIGLGIFNGFSAIDIDHCVDNGKPNKMAQEIIDFCNSYTEFSPSGTGIRIIFKSTIKIDKNKYYINNAKNGLEIYISDNTNKFVTITGNNINNNDINEIDVTEILEKYMKRSVPLMPTISPAFNNEVNISIEYALNKDAKLYELWYKQAPGSHSNESELDLALCCKLAFYCNGDFNKIKQTFESSPYYASKDELHKNKWAGVYSTNTINMAINFVGTQSILPKPIYEPEQISKKIYGLNDTGNAHRFADKFSNNIHYNVDNEMWMLWNGKFWETDIKGKIRDYVDILAQDMTKDLRNEDDEIRRKIISQNINHIQNNGGKKALLEECQHIGEIPVLNSDFDNDPYLLCANNMIYNLKTGEQLPFKKEYMISQTLSCDIDLDNEPVKWIKFFEDILENDEEMINYVRKVLAYCMSGSTREQQMWVFYGDGNNGKSLMLEIFSELMGSYSITSRPELIVDSKNSNTSSEEIARLKGKRVTILEELKDGDRMNESLVKQLTSGLGKMTGRFLYGNTFEFTMKAKILQASNYKSKVKGIDKGIWRRINLVPLYRDFTAVLNKDLREELMEELPQIAGWLIKGFKLYLEEGLDNKPQKVLKETKEYKEESDIVQTWINENCEVEKGAWTRASELFEDFVLWCKRNQENILTQTAFGRNMGKKFKRLTYSTGKVYSGIKLRVQPDNLNKKVEYDLIDIDKSKI